MKFFSYESKFSQILLKISGSCLLNLLWFVCSLPIVTIGASTTALYYASLKLVRDEDHHIVSQFFRSFRENFKQATVLWLILLGAGLFLAADGYILYHLRLTAAGPAAVWGTIPSDQAVVRLGGRYRPAIDATGKASARQTRRIVRDHAVVERGVVYASSRSL